MFFAVEIHHSVRVERTWKCLLNIRLAEQAVPRNRPQQLSRIWAWCDEALNRPKAADKESVDRTLRVRSIEEGDFARYSG